MKTRMVAVCAVTVLAAVILSSCGKEEQVEKEVVRPVVTMVAPEAGAGRQRSFSGTAQAAVETLLSFRVGGEITELPVKQGMQVRSGEVVARLDATDRELQVKQNEAQLAQAAAQLEQARADYERVRQLYETDSVSKSDLDSSQAAFKSAQAQRDAYLKGLELSEQQLDYCTLRAPVDGTIAVVPVEAHQTVSAGQTMATLTSGDEMEMELGIPEALISVVSVGDPATVEFEAVSGVTLPARVSEVGVEVGESSTYPVKLRLLEQDPRIRAGMVGEAIFFFASDSGAEAIIIPQVAVVPTPDGERYIWIYQKESGKVRKQMVRVGDLTSEGLQILKGLSPGEIVVIRGVHRLSEGMKVRLLEE